MSASSHRSSSAVRDLRNIFENKASESLTYDPRGRSPNGLSGSDKENGRPQSKIRASFVPVELAPNMADQGEQTKAQDATHEKASTNGRRSSFIEGAEGGPLSDMKNAVTEEHEKREKDESVEEPVPEAAVESAAPTPALQNTKNPIDEAPVLESDLPSANPDKPVTGAEEEPGNLKPADPTSAEAVSGGDGLSATAEDLREANKTTNAAATLVPAPSKISTRVPAKSANTPKSPASGKASSPSPHLSSHSGSSKPPRASLIAPTAASAARTAPQEKMSSSTPVKSKPREPTRPLELSSRLTAPTAAFKAKHEPEPAASLNFSKPHSLGRPQAARSTPRSSLAGGSKPEANGTSRKLAPAPDASFLERMMRPTAASQSKVSDKVESKSPPPKPKPIARRPKPATAKAADTNTVAKGEELAQGQTIPESGTTEPAETAEPTALESSVPAATVEGTADAAESDAA